MIPKYLQSTPCQRMKKKNNSCNNPARQNCKPRGSMLPIHMFRYTVYDMIMLREGTKKRPSVLRSWYTIGIETASDVIKVLPVKARNRMRHTDHRSCFHSKRANPFMLHSVCIAIVLVPALCVAGSTKLASMRSMSLMQRNNTPR